MIKKLILFLLISFGIIATLNMNINSASRTTRMMQNTTQSTAALQQLASMFKRDGANVYAPVGQSGANYYELPSSIVGSRLQANGSPFLYCPFALQPLVSGDPTSEVTDLSSSPMNVVQSVVGGRDVVVRSDFPSTNGLIAAIIEVRGTHVSCRDITPSTNGNWELSGGSAGNGIVYGLHVDSLPPLLNTAFISINAVDGEQKNIDTQIDAAFARPEKDVVISLDAIGSGQFVMSNHHSFVDGGIGRKFILRSQNRARISGAGSLGTDASLFRIENVSVDPGFVITAANSDVTIRNSVLSSTTLSNSKALIDSSSFTSLTGSALSLNSGVISLKGAVTIVGDSMPAWVIKGAVIQSSSANVTAQSFGSPVVIDFQSGQWFSGSDTINVIGNGIGGVSFGASSQLKFKQSVFNVSGVSDALVYSYGDLVLDESAILGVSASSLWVSESSLVRGLNAQIGDNTSRSASGVWLLGDGLIGSFVVYGNAQCISGPATESIVNVDTQDRTVASVNPDGSVNQITVTTSQSLNKFDLTKRASVSCL